MKVKEYIIKRIMELEQINKESAAQYQGLQYALRDANKRCDELIDKVDQLTMEREHIKQIITCNIAESIEDHFRMHLDLAECEDDFKSLLAILDIKPEDYEVPKDEKEDNTPIYETEYFSCDGCEHEYEPDHVYPCCVCDECNRYTKKEVNPDVETKD